MKKHRWTQEEKAYNLYAAALELELVKRVLCQSYIKYKVNWNGRIAFDTTYYTDIGLLHLGSKKGYVGMPDPFLHKAFALKTVEEEVR